MNQWWGEPWPSAQQPAEACADPDQRLSYYPLDQECLLCEHLIGEGESGLTMPVWQAEAGGSVIGFAHKECQLRAVLGNHLHVRGLCSYTGECVRLSKLTYREESLAVWNWVMVEGHEPVIPEH